MTSWKQSFMISRRFHETTLPKGYFWIYTCVKDAKGGEQLVFCRRAGHEENSKVTSIANSWIAKNDFVSETDMLTYLFAPISYLGGLLIIKMRIIGETLKERRDYLQKIWHDYTIAFENIDQYEILYFQTYPTEDSDPFVWDSQLFQQNQVQLYYYNTSHDLNHNWLRIPVVSELYKKLLEEGSKPVSKYITVDDVNYYFGESNGKKVCYFYQDQNPSIPRRRLSFGKAKYVEPTQDGKKYLWLTSLPECGQVGITFKH